jgi:hypothetical protein
MSLEGANMTKLSMGTPRELAYIEAKDIIKQALVMRATRGFAHPFTCEDESERVLLHVLMVYAEHGLSMK